MFEQIEADPPDPNFEVISPPSPAVLPESGSGAVTDELARAFEAQKAYGDALVHAVERYQGALAAGDVAWQHRQAIAASELSEGLVREMLATAKAIRAYAAQEGAVDPRFDEPVVDQVRLDEIVQVYQRVRSQGLTAEELSQLVALGLTDAEIAAVRSEFDLPVEATPVGISLADQLSDLADALEQNAEGFDLFGRVAASIAGQIAQAPSASFTASPLSGAGPLEVAFTNTSTSPDLDPVESIEWQFGDGTTGTGESPSHTYTANGSYTVTLTVCDYLDCDSAQERITVGGGVSNRPPVAVDDVLEVGEDFPGSVDVLSNDDDADGDALTISSFSVPAHGSVIRSGTGLRYSPVFNYNGSDSFTYTISDGRGGTDTATVSVTVAPLNDPPTAAHDSLTIVRDTQGEVNVLANDTDPDGDALTVAQVQSMPLHGDASCLPNGDCTYTPDPGFVGGDQFEYRAVDPDGAISVRTVTVTVTPVGRPPVASFTIRPERGLSPLKVRFDASASTDPDGEVVEYRWDFGDGSTATGSTADHTYTAAGPFTVRLTVVDNDGNAIPSFPRTVLPKLPESLELPICGDAGDAAPVRFNCPDYTWTPDVQLFELGGTGEIEIVADFILRGGAHSELVAFNVDDRAGSIGGLRPDDPGYIAAALERAQIVFARGSEPTTPDVSLQFEGGGYVVFMLVAFDTLEGFKAANPTNDVSRGPDAFFSLDELNGDGVDHFASFIKPSDGSVQFGFEDLPFGGDLDFDDIVFNVYGSLTPVASLAVAKQADERVSEPGASNGYTIEVSNSGTFPATIESVTDVLPDGFAYLPGTTTGATSGEPAIDGQELTWDGPFELEPGENVTIHFGVTVSTVAGTYLNEASADAGVFEVTPTGPTAEIVVEGIVVEPVLEAVHDTLVVDEGTAGQKDVLANDTGPSLTVTASTQGAHGTVSCTPAGVCTYTPEPGYSGPDSFTYTASNADGSDTATVDVTVNPVNDPPVAVNDSASTPQGVAKDVNVLANDSDPDGDTRSVTGYTQGANGSVSCIAAGLCTYTPDAGYSGPDSFTYTVSDGHGGTATATVSVTVTPVSQVGVSGKGVFNTAGNGKVTFTLSSSSVKLAQSSGRKFTFDGAVATVVGGAGTATMTGSGKWNGTSGYTFEITVVDKGSPGYRKGDTIAVVIRSPSGAPVFSWGPERLKTGDVRVTGGAAT